MRVSVFLFQVLILFLFFLKPAWVMADYYVFDQGKNTFIDPQVIERAEYFHSIYGLLSPGEETIDYYAFTNDEFIPQMQVELLVSVKEKETFRPSLIFTDPFQTGMYGQVPFGFPPRVGGRVWSWPLAIEKKGDTTVWENFYEGPRILKDLSPNTYILGVFDPTGKGGRYVLRLGSMLGPETLTDKFSALMALARIKLLLY